MSPDRRESSDYEPDESIEFCREIEIFDDAEDVKVVRFHGDSNIIDVGITDEVMVEFLSVAEEVFVRIHQDMAEIHDIFSDADDRLGGDA